MKRLLVIFPLLLTSCSQTGIHLLTPEYKIVKAPEDLYKCPVETKFPKSDTLIDQEVGSLVLKLQKNNLTCKNSMDSIHQFYDQAEKTINDKK